MQQLLSGVHVNIFDLLRAKRRGSIPFRFRSRGELAMDLKENPKRKYPLEAAKQNKLLCAFLVEVGG